VYYYSAYSLHIGSDIPLLELPSTDRGGDVNVLLRKPRPLDAPQSIRWIDGPQKEARFLYPQTGEFQVRNGCEVIVTPAPGAEADLLRLYVQGMMLAAVLYQRGLFVLHSSIVSREHGAIALVGPVGIGKSTLASGFHARGFSVVADDNAAIDVRTVPLTVQPAFPTLKIYPDVATALGYDAHSLTPMHRSQRKHAQTVRNGFAAQPVRLTAIYVLDREADPNIRSISTVDAVTEIIRHSVPTRWNVAGDAEHLKQCGLLASRIPIFRARSFSNLFDIQRVLDCIQAHHEETTA